MEQSGTGTNGGDPGYVLSLVSQYTDKFIDEYLRVNEDACKIGLGTHGYNSRINRNRRLAKDFEATIASARAFLYAASVMLLVRRLARAA